MANQNFHVPITLKNHIKNAEEFEALIKKAQTGCAESRDKLVEGNLKLVINVVRKFKGRESQYDDLFQIGTIGLIKAIDYFDLSRNVQFSTYAVPMIKGEIRRHLRDNNTIKISRIILENSRKIKSFQENFILQYERKPKLSEIKDTLQMEYRDISMALGVDNEIVSFSKPLSENSEDKTISLEESLVSETNSMDVWFDKQYLQEAFKKLDEKEKNIIISRFFEDKTQQEVGERLGISQAHVSRIEKSALVKLKKII